MKDEHGNQYAKDLGVHLPREEGIHVGKDNRTMVMTKIFYHNYTDPKRFDHFDPTEKDILSGGSEGVYPTFSPRKWDVYGVVNPKG